MNARLIALISGQPWAIHGPALETIYEIANRETPDQATIDRWKSPGTRDALESKPGTALPGSRNARMRDGVAVIPVSGPIFRYANMMTDHSGATSLASVASDLALARDDARVKSAIITIDSPGGEVTGMMEMSAAVRDFATVKPIVAYCEGMACSAAYQIAAAASEIIVSPTAMLGSLGVVVGMTDRRDAEAKAGVKRYDIVSSQTPGKRPDVATDAGRAAYQALADRTADEFLADVAANRGMSVDDLLEASGGGGMLIGTDAVSAGLADGISGFEDLLSRMSRGGAPIPRRIHRPARPAAENQKEKPMTATVETVETPVAVAPVAVPVVTDTGPSERIRAAAIMTATLPGFQALAALAIANGWSFEVFTAAQDASGPAVTAAVVAAQGAAFRESLPAPVGSGNGDPQPDTPQAKWASDPALRAEFGDDFGRYTAFIDAEAAGKVRRLTGRTT